ncbi:MAG: acetylornithine deacetylase [Chromatiales bacterium]|nr:acetylornithine deacetylase [Chromatiales bacterium]
MPTPPLMTMIADLIGTPSMSSVSPAFDIGNGPVIEKLASWLKDAGFGVEILPIQGYPGKFNLIAVLGRGEGGLVLSGHTDTVPYDENRWSQDPFRLTERDQRLYGLGTADMKSFFALAIEAARGLRHADLKRPLTILATADEESSMCGAQALLDQGRRLGDYAVIGEPTGMKPIRMHKGIFMDAIRLTGRAGHSSDPALGNSALEGMHKVLGELLAWRSELQAKHRNPAFAVPVPTLNLGHIHGGDNPNRICGQCELHIDLRPLPGMDQGELRAQVRNRLETGLAGSGLQLEILPLFEGIPAMETAAQSAIVRAAEQLTGSEAQAVAFGTEAPYLNALGVETLVMGPGHIDQAHQPDEYIALDQLHPGVDLLRSLIQRFCMESAPSEDA